MRTESLPSSENNPVETNTPWDNIDDDAKTPLEARDGNTQLGADESAGTDAPVEADPFDPPLSIPEPDAPPAPDVPPTPEPIDESKTPIEYRDGDTQLGTSEVWQTADPYGGANGENTGDQVNQVE